MNTWQTLKQLRYLIRAARWSGSSTVVFAPASVLITSAPTPETLANHRVPICLIRPGAARIDPEFEGEQADVLERDLVLTLISAISGDAGTGENSIVGANRVSVNQSENRGLLELEEEVFDAVKQLNEIEGVSLLMQAAGAGEISRVQDMGHVTFADYQFRLLCTANRFYHPPRELSATASGGGAVALTWALPPDRFDRFKVVLRRAAGSTPPASATDGTGVTLASNLATSVTDTPGAGAFAYSLFAAYDETYDERIGSPATADRYSAAATDTVTAT